MALIDSSTITSLLNVAYIVFFIAFFVYGQGIQRTITLRGLKSNISKLERFELSSKSKLLSSLSKFAASKTLDSTSAAVERLVGSFVITPVSLDPSGIVPKLGHVLDTADENLKSEIKRIAPNASDSEVYNLSNLAEITIELTNLYKVARHFYLLGSKQGGSLATLQLQMIMPQLIETAEAYSAATDAFANGKTVGDGFGPLVASNLLLAAAAASNGNGNDVLPWKEIVKDTYVAKTEIAGRPAYVVKAKGPGGNVGRPAEAVEKLLSEDPSVKFILTVDAALKLEGEETGQIAEGVGIAIGGPGVERYKVEELATNRGISTLALVAKMSEKEAITEIPKAVKEQVSPVISRMEEIVKENVPQGSGSVIVAGIGNTLGVE
jgi:hypothetical protein